MTRDTSERRFSRNRQAADAAPDDPTDLSGRSWWAVLKRTVKAFKADNLTDWAAALTYYGVLAIFPAIIALVSIIGLIGPSATQPILDNLAALTPGPANDILSGAVKQVASSRGSASLAFIFGIALAIWSASGYVGAFARASNAIYEVPEGRPFWKLRPMQLFVTTVMILLIAACALAVVVTGPVAKQLGDVVGAGSTAVTAWDIAKWPIIALVVSLMFSVLYFAAPNVKQPGFKWITVGGVRRAGRAAGRLGALRRVRGQLRLLQQDLRRARRRDRVPGVVVGRQPRVLLGAELNAELERDRELAAGQPAEDELQIELRDDRKVEDQS